jgi:hypothetical protein
MEGALRRALTLVGDHECDGYCPLTEYVNEQEEFRITTEAPSKTIGTPDP